MSYPALMQNKSYLLPIALLAMVIILLLVAAVFILTPKIQNSLAQQVRERLKAEGIPAMITLTGRDVTLSGTVASQSVKKNAEAVTQKICGIRFIDNQLLTEKPENLALITPASATPQQTASLSHNKPAQNKKKTTSQTPAPTTSRPLPSSQISSPANRPAKPSGNKPQQAIEPSQANTDKQQPAIRKSLSYESLLAAMQAYTQQKKGRNIQPSQTLSIHFKADSDEIISTSKKQVEQLSQRLLKDKNQRIELLVTAKTSALALKRATTIRNQLILLGVSKQQLRISGKTGKPAVLLKRVITKSGV